MKDKFHLPPIGARILKSSVGVALCILTFLLRGESGMPFYSALAVLWCMQPYSETTLTMAKQRSIGTLLGAGFGLVFLLAQRLFPSPNAGVVYFCAAAVIIPLIYVTVLLNKQNASFFSCVVFLSITITHSFDDDPYMFVLNRVIDTFIGIAIGMALNIPLWEPKHDNTVLYLSGIDDVLVNERNAMIPYNKVELNRLIAKGAMFSVSTVETPATLISLMEGVNLKLPVIAMDGAVLYDISENSYIDKITLRKDTAARCEKIVGECGLHCFVNALCDNTLLIYYGEFANENERDLFTKLRRSPYRNYVRKEYRGDSAEVVYLLVLAENRRIEALKDRLISELGDDIRITLTPAKEYDGYSRMRIYSPDSGKEVMLKRLVERTGASGSVTFGSIEGRYDVIVHDDGGNSAVKEFRRRYKKSRAKTNSAP